jgi:DNA-binding transcriptional LysR family regulator
VARRLAPNHRLLCATPGYLAIHGEPKTLADLSRHHLLATAGQDPWRLEGPQGAVTFHVDGRLKTHSNEVVREAVIAGLGIALRSTWDVGPELREGRLVHVLPAYRASRRVAVHAVYPSRRFLAAKVRLFIDFLASLYGEHPQWDEGLGTIIRE